MRLAILFASFGTLLGGCAEPTSHDAMAPIALATTSPPGTPPPTTTRSADEPTALPRKIIYKAEFDLLVPHFAEAQSNLARLVKQEGGYIAQSDVAGSPGSSRSGRWVVRIPVDQLDSFEDAVIALGELQKRHRDSQDVTEEYFDLDARIKNKVVEETRLLKHLTDSTGSLKETLEVEKELSRVRGEIELLQGRLRLLGNLTSLTTVTISLAERDRYQPAASPRFATRASRVFFASVATLQEGAGRLALLIVAVIPWLPIAVLAWLGFWVGKRIYRSRFGETRRG